MNNNFVAVKEAGSEGCDTFPISYLALPEVYSGERSNSTIFFENGMKLRAEKDEDGEVTLQILMPEGAKDELESLRSMNESRALQCMEAARDCQLLAAELNQERNKAEELKKEMAMLRNTIEVMGKSQPVAETAVSNCGIVINRVSITKFPFTSKILGWVDCTINNIKFLDIAVRKTKYPGGKNLVGWPVVYDEKHKAHQKVHIPKELFEEANKQILAVVELKLAELIATMPEPRKQAEKPAEAKETPVPAIPAAPANGISVDAWLDLKAPELETGLFSEMKQLFGMNISEKVGTNNGKYKVLFANGFKFMTQNPEKDSRTGKLAKAGHRVTHVIAASSEDDKNGQYYGQIFNGHFKRG